jgi:hypothetical protein
VWLGLLAEDDTSGSKSNPSNSRNIIETSNSSTVIKAFGEADDDVDDDDDDDDDTDDDDTEDDDNDDDDDDEDADGTSRERDEDFTPVLSLFLISSLIDCRDTILSGIFI